MKDIRNQKAERRTPKMPSKSIEHDYPKHKRNPGPSEEAVVEKDEDGAGKVLKWILPALVIILLICWFIVKK